ncbi:MAG: UTP--glucose-1-phosphate uridylyltransferase GalU [Patescibacteria group bacterium]|nr:UTP--glucose-1-phosphate uridylyltransferase GalU [Patescibacteria group bacterium]MBU2509270.1 UTP--glucose-1-phosphate uridylyltransferase GalU [Patescibacteria group bacterium]
MKKVRKVILPVAGYGTRFLPATKAMPKEMLPIIDKPVIQYVVEEAVASGIEDVILVTSQSKHAVEDHFDDNKELEAWLQSTGKDKQLEEIREIGKLANFIYVRQKGPYGNATPVLNCRHLIGDEPFAVLFGDELFSGDKPRLKQMIEVYEKYQDPVLGVIEVDDRGTERYGIIDPAAEVEAGIYQLKGMVEKPGPKKAPSHLAAIGAYILTPDIFDSITKTPSGHGGELVLLDAIFGLMKTRPVYAKKLEGEYHDTGNKLGWLKANVNEALRRSDMKKETIAMLKEIQ